MMPAAPLVGASDDAPAGGVLFIDGDRVQIDPVDHRKRIAQRQFRIARQIAIELRRAALHLEWTGQRAVRSGGCRYRSRARRTTASRPRFSADRRAFPLRYAIRARFPTSAAQSICGRRAPARAVRCRCERMRQLLEGGKHLRVRRTGRHDKTAADRQIRRFAQRPAGVVERVKLQAVRMLGERLPVERDVDPSARTECRAGRAAPACASCGRLRAAARSCPGLTVSGASPSRPSITPRSVRALAGGAERTIQIDLHRCRGVEQPVAFEALSEHQRGAPSDRPVCELDGPMPILKRSNTLTAITAPAIEVSV